MYARWTKWSWPVFARILRAGADQTWLKAFNRPVGSASTASKLTFAQANSESMARAFGCRSSLRKSCVCCWSVAERSFTREELKQRLWPTDTFVDFDDGLNTAVKKSATSWAIRLNGLATLRLSLAAVTGS